MRPLAPILLLAAIAPAPAQELLVYPEFQRPSTDGSIVAADRRGERREILSPAVPRNGYASFFLVVKLRQPDSFRLDVAMNPEGNLQTDLYRAWFHKLDRSGEYYPDALIPVQNTYLGRLPDPENRVPNQTAAVFWLDLYVPRDAPVERVRVELTLQSGTRTDTYPMEVRVLPAIVPDDDALHADHNSYSANWLAQAYPKAAAADGDGFFRSDRFFDLIHAYHRLLYEHRAIFHQLGYGHAGKVAPEFAPAIEGSGRGKHIVSWDLYDRHYGPLFDGSAFRSTRRGPRPIPYAYLPINPEWPASFLYWDQPGYEAEFVNVVSEMERRFREKGWTRTRLEMFFNHKKRYKGFPWDGDEVRFARDNEYFRRFHALLQKAVPRDSPVRFVFRSDSSWSMGQQFEALDGVVNFWILSRGILSFYPDAPEMLRRRGSTAWFYGSAPGVAEPAHASAHHAARAWMWGVDGYVLWLTTGCGDDPWFGSFGGSECLVYPGERFGVDGPIPSVRLKIQRNALQDLALLRAMEGRLGRDRLRAELAALTNSTRPEHWWTIPAPKLLDLSPDEWTNPDIEEAARPMHRPFRNLTSDWWPEVRRWVYRHAREGETP